MATVMSELVIEQGPPSGRAEGIRALFTRAGKPEFGEVYDRVYTVRERTGMRSWIGLIDDRVVLHISVARHAFTDGSRTLMGGLPADLMADDGHRDFWSPIKLVRRMVADVRTERLADFLLSSYAPAAEPVFRAGGFKQFAMLRRFLMPLVWPYPLVRRLMLSHTLPPLRALPFQSFDGDLAARGVSSPGCFRPIPDASYYATRMPRQAYPLGTWLLAGSEAAPEAAFLISPRGRGEAEVVDVVWRGSSTPLEALFAAAAHWAASAGHSRMGITINGDSRVASAVRRAGFIQRPGEYRVLALTIPGIALPSVEAWCLTPFILTAW